MSDEIRPALNLNEDAPNELSAEEFQRQLYAWFEDRGLLSELRAHLRMQMIGILKDTAIGRSVSSQIKQAVSPKLQAINLLIAEFLLHQEYHYSLCVFSTEVPLINVFPDFSNCIIRNSAETTATDPKKWRFKQKDVWDILETFGILHDSREGKDICTMYYGNDDESLLTCIVRILHLINTINKPNLNFDINWNKAESSNTVERNKWAISHINELLARANINKQYSTQIEEHILKVLKNEEQRIIDEKREEYAKLNAKLEEETTRRIEKYKQRVSEIEKTFEVERTKLEDELHRTKSSLKQCAETLHTRFEKLEEREKHIRIREKELQKKEEQLQRNRLALENQIHKINCEKYDIIKMRHQIQADYEKQDLQPTKQLQNDCDRFKSDRKETCDVSETIVKVKKDKVNRSQQTSDNSDVENALMKQLVRQLQNENLLLRNQNRDQQIRVQALAQNANLLIRDIGNNEPRTLNNFGSNFRGSLQTVAPSMPTLSVHMPNNNELMAPNGSGEECIVNINGRRAAPLLLGSNFYQDSVYVRPPVSPRIYRNATLSRETRRRLLNRRYSNTSSSDEPSPTDEILQEARERLRALEQESEEIDRNFRNYSRRNRDGNSIEREREIRGHSHVSHDSHYISRNKSGNLRNLSFTDRYNVRLSNLDANITKILSDHNASTSSDVGTFRIIQNDFPSTSTAVAYNLDSLNNLPINSATRLDGSIKPIKSREQNMLFFQSKPAEPLFQDREKESMYLDMMKLLTSPSTSKAEDQPNEDNNNDNLLEDELRDNRASTGQSGNSSGFLQDVLPGTSEISLSSIDVSSDHENLSIKKHEGNLLQPYFVKRK